MGRRVRYVGACTCGTEKDGGEGIRMDHGNMQSVDYSVGRLECKTVVAYRARNDQGARRD